MKRIMLVSGLLLVIAASLGLFFLNAEKLTPDDPAGKKIYYTRIKGSGYQDVDARYHYLLMAYNKSGKEKELAFSAGKELEEGAYIQLYDTWIRGVTHWQEVAFEELPQAVQEQYSGDRGGD